MLQIFCSFRKPTKYPSVGEAFNSTDLPDGRDKPSSLIQSDSDSSLNEYGG